MHRLIPVSILMTLITVMSTACGGTVTSPPVTTTPTATVASVAPTMGAAVAPSDIDRPVLRVAQKGFSISQSNTSTTQTVNYGYIIENPHPTFATYGVRVEIAAIGGDGTIYGSVTAGTEFDVLNPKARTGDGGGMSVPKGVAIAQVEVRATYQRFNPPNENLGALTVENGRVFPGAYGGYEASGFVQSTQPLRSGRLAVVCYDPTGAIIGGGRESLKDIATGERVAATIRNVFVEGMVARGEVFAVTTERRGY